MEDATALPPKPTPVRSGLYLPGIYSRSVTGFCLVVILALRVFDMQLHRVLPSVLADPAIVNLICLVLGFTVFVSLTLWFFFYSIYKLRTKLLVTVAGFAVLAALFAAVRLDGFSGNSVPRFAWRWTPPADTQLEPLAPAATKTDEAPRIDMVSTTVDDFPRFLGPQATAVVTRPKLAHSWDKQPPKLLWKQPIGAGWSAFSVVNGYAVTLEQRGPEEWVSCYRAETGEPVWGAAIEARHESPLGGIGPRSTPTIHNGRVYAMHATGVLRCLDGATGDVVWQVDLLARAGVTLAEDLTRLAWGRSASPLIVDDWVVVPLGGAPGKTHSLIAFQQSDGKEVWVGGDRQISYAAPALVELAGTRQIVNVNEDTVAGYDVPTGKELWHFDWPGGSSSNASCSQAIALGDDRVMISKGYAVGAAVYKISHADDQWKTEEVWANPRVLRTKFTNIAVIGDEAYGLSDGILQCADVATGKSHWRKGRYGNGQLLGVGDAVLIISEEGELVLVKATPDEFRELAKIQAIEGRTWNNVCLWGNRVLVRNGEEAACYELPLAE